MTSPYESALTLDGLHPRLRAYFGEIPAGSVGRGTGVFDVVGTPKRWLWPVLWVLGRQGVVFPTWARAVPFDVVNMPSDGALAATRTFHFGHGDRSMVDLISVHDGELFDSLGANRRYRARLHGEVVDAALHLFSSRMWVRLGTRYLAFPLCPTVDLTERWDEAVNRQHVSVTITAPVIGTIYEYAGHFDYEVSHV